MHSSKKREEPSIAIGAVRQEDANGRKENIKLDDQRRLAGQRVCDTPDMRKSTRTHCNGRSYRLRTCLKGRRHAPVRPALGISMRVPCLPWDTQPARRHRHRASTGLDQGAGRALAPAARTSDARERANSTSWIFSWALPTQPAIARPSVRAHYWSHEMRTPAPSAVARQATRATCSARSGTASGHAACVERLRGHALTLCIEYSLDAGRTARYLSETKAEICSQLAVGERACVGDTVRLSGTARLICGTRQASHVRAWERGGRGRGRARGARGGRGGSGERAHRAPARRAVYR